MNRREVIAGLALPLFARAGHAQPLEKHTIGFLSANSREAMSARTAAFQKGLREFGYIEGGNLVVEYRFADGRQDRLRGFADELVGRRVRVIVTEGTTATRFAKEATSTIPIVMAQDPDPVGTGFVTSLARPGGNITGLSNLRPDLDGKRLELLRDTLPKLARVSVLRSSATPGAALTSREIERSAAATAVLVQFVEISSPGDIGNAFEAAAKQQADAILVTASPIVLSHRKQILDLAHNARLPAIYYTREFVTEGGLMSYGASATALFHRSASYVDRLLKGASPADLPIEQPASFELVINQRSAKALGLTIPQVVLNRADEVIE